MREVSSPGMRFITGPTTGVENGSKSVSDVPIAGTETCLTTYTGTGTHMYMVSIWNLDRLCRRHEEAGTPAKQLQDSILRNIIRYLQLPGKGGIDVLLSCAGISLYCRPATAT